MTNNILPSGFDKHERGITRVFSSKLLAHMKTQNKSEIKSTREKKG